MKFQGKSVLIIDDDPDFQVLLGKIFKNQGMIVKGCQDLRTAVSILNEFGPDVIILDLNLEKESGTSFLKVRSGNPKLSKIPVIVCSAENVRATVEKVLSLGCHDYMLKPIKQTVLLQKLNKVLREEPKISYLFDERPTVLVETTAECIAISEAYCQIRSNFRFVEKVKLKMKLEVLEKEEIPVHDFRVNIKSWSLQPGVYDTTFTMIGISEPEAQKLRKMKLGWRPK